MVIEVLFFGSLAHEVGVSSCALELSDNARISDALDALAERYQAIEKHLPQLATAVNLEYLGPGHVLSSGDELALIPPVSGG